MVALRKDTTSLSQESIKNWWHTQAPTLRQYLRLIQQSPFAYTGDLESFASQLQWLYTQLQHTDSPTSADQLKAHLSNSVLYLFMSIETMTQDNFVQSDIYYQRALTEYNLVRALLSGVGIEKAS